MARVLFGWRGISGRAGSGGNVAVVVGDRMGRTGRCGVGIGVGRSAMVATGGRTKPSGFGVTVW
jgi:hypothetical protein